MRNENLCFDATPAATTTVSSKSMICKSMYMVFFVNRINFKLRIPSKRHQIKNILTYIYISHIFLIILNKIALIAVTTIYIVIK